MKAGFVYFVKPEPDLMPRKKTGKIVLSKYLCKIWHKNEFVPYLYN